MSSPLDDVPGGTVRLTEDLRIAEANRRMGRLVGRPIDTLIGQPLDVLLTAPSRILFQTHVHPALRNHGRVEEVFLTIASGTDAAMPVLLNAERDAEGSGYMGLIVRVEARATWERDLLTATRALAAEKAATEGLNRELTEAAAERAARQEFRDAFIGVVSHELRTPVTTIYGMSHVALEHLDTLATDEIRDRLGDIRAEAERLRRLTEDLLVLARAEGGRLDVEVEPVSVRHVISSAIRTEWERAAGHEVTIDVPPDVPPGSGEAVFLEQIVRNYLGNALKYSPSGAPVLIQAAPEDGGIAIRVRDEGPGFGDVPPERLFDVFYRTPEAMRKAAGAGIGLFVCRELARAMGGRVWARSEPDGRPGAEFGVWIPRAEEPDED